MSKGKSNYVTIKDPLFGEYFIIIDDLQFNLVTEGKPDKKGNPTVIIHGHYRNLSNLLTDLVKYRFNEHFNGDVITIKEYIDRYEKMFENFKKAINK